MKTFIRTVLTSFVACSLALGQAEPSAENTTPENATLTAEQTEQLWLSHMKANYPAAKPEGSTGQLGSYATIKVGKGQLFLNGGDTNKLMMEAGNLSSQYAGGIEATDHSYTILFEFEAVGYIKDEDEIDADAIMASFKDNDEANNKARRAQNLSTMTTEGWAIKPHYNSTSNNLEYAIKFRDEDGSYFVNHFVKILGRRGVMNAVLICNPEELESLRPMLASTLDNYSYSSGQKYAEYKEGDKIAEYGLNGLIAGGVIFGAAKLGFFAKFWKVIVIGFVAVCGFFAKIKNKIFGS